MFIKSYYLMDKAFPPPLTFVLLFRAREMESTIQLPERHGLKFALVAGLTLLTTDALFAQSAGQSDLDALKARMDQMQKQYEQRIDKMDQERKPRAPLDSPSNREATLLYEEYR